MEQIQLLLVDDEQLIRESLQIVLDMEDDIQVVGLAENGQEAIQLCETFQPNFILMDINMPVLNGVEAVKEIKKRWSDCRVIMLTTFKDMNHVMDSLSAGADGYLLKAIPPKELIDGIRIVHIGGTLIPQRLAKQLFANQSISYSSPKSNSTTTDYQLTEREEEVVRGIADGLTNKDIAQKLFLTEGTVKNYISSIYSKLDVATRTEAVKKVREEGLI